MGEFSKKYSSAYFLGGRAALNGQKYGLHAYGSFRKKEVHHRFEDLSRFIESFAGHLNGKNILEIGFGRGEMIPYFLKEKCQSYHGIDFSKAAVKIAKDRYSDPKVTLKHMEAKKLNEDAAYDVIVMNQVIEHIPVFEMAEVWKNVKRALRPGGYIILGVPFYSHPNEADHMDEIHETMGMHCNKQTRGTIYRTCLEQGFILAKTGQDTIGLVCKKDLLKFPFIKRVVFLSTQEKIFTNAGISTHYNDEDEKKIRKLVPGAGRVLIGCVTENNEKYYDRTLRLVQSIRWFGGKLAGANIIVCFVDEADPSYVEELQQWGVFVRIVKRFSKHHPPSNKLRLFELPEIKFYDTIMFLDCDTVIVQDPTAHIDGKCLQAKIANGPSVPHTVFKKLFKHYRLQLPKQDYLTSHKSLKTIWYCNTGVLIFPQPLLADFYPVWKRYTEDLAEKKNLMDKSHAFCEQASLTLAFSRKPVPFKPLTNQMNCPMREDKLDPVIIHYRNAVKSNGDLMIRKNTGFFLAERIKLFNQRAQTYRERKEQRRFEEKSN